MSSPPNFLRVYRKRSPLTHADIAYLMKLPDYSNISRYEKGQRTPSIDLIILYHFLFDTSIESFFEPLSADILTSLIERIEMLIIDLKKVKRNPKNSLRLKFLEQALIRLTK